MRFAPLVSSIEVACSQKQAFHIFIHEMGSWWPLEKFTTTAFTGNAAAGIRVDARVGGDIIEISPNGKEYLWGTIEEFKPYALIRMKFHIPHPAEVVMERSVVEIAFEALEPNRTRVVLKQSNWEAFGSRAKDLHGGYGGGWQLIFEVAFKNACNLPQTNIE